MEAEKRNREQTTAIVARFFEVKKTQDLACEPSHESPEAGEETGRDAGLT
jgi:hypothetical protein